MNKTMVRGILLVLNAFLAMIITDLDDLQVCVSAFIISWCFEPFVMDCIKDAKRKKEKTDETKLINTKESVL